MLNQIILALALMTNNLNVHASFLPSFRGKCNDCYSPIGFLNKKKPIILRQFVKNYPYSSSLLTKMMSGNSGKKNSTQQNQNNRTKMMYSPTKAHTNGTIKMDSIHTIYYEEHGKQQPNDDIEHYAKQKRTNALFVHGGPGAGCFPNHARFFNPDLYQRIILMDQRGCGRSMPRGEIQNNTLGHLVQDIEVLRETLGIEKWDVILGGSWGCTLTLAYAQTFPERVGSIVLRGVCLMRDAEIEWLFDRDSNSNFSLADRNPSAWSNFSNAVNPFSPDLERKSLENVIKEDKGIDDDSQSHDVSTRRAVLKKYYDCLLGDNAFVRAYATRQWSQWEYGASSVKVKGDIYFKEKFDYDDLNLIWNNSYGWSLQTANNSTHKRKIASEISASEVASKVRNWFNHTKEHKSGEISTLLSLKPRKVAQQQDPVLINIAKNDLKSVTEEEAEKFIPAQVMLTCFYSINNNFMLNEFDLLSKKGIDRIRHIPCISIQGGDDSICPVSTAFDLHDVWPEMDMVTVLNGKHSMYDPTISNEIIKATDHMAETNISR